MMRLFNSIFKKKPRLIKPINLVRYPIQSKLLAFFTLLVVFSLGLTLYFALDLFYKDKSAYVFEASLAKAEVDGKLVADFFNEKISDAAIISQFISKDKEGDSLRVFLQKKSDILDFSVFSKTDDTWTTDKKNVDFINARVETRQLFAKIDQDLLLKLDLILKQRLMVFFNLDFPELPIATIAIADKSYPRVLMLKVSAKSLQQIFGPTGSPFKSFLINDDKAYLFAQEASFSYGEFFRQVYSQNVLQGVIDLKVSDQNFLLAFQKLPSFGLTTLSVLSKDSAFKVAQTLIFKSLAIGVLIIALSLIAGVFVSRSLTRPINQLMDATKRVSSGDFQSKVQILSQDEFTVLGRSFNFMCDEIHRYMDEIKDKIRMEDELALAQLVQSSFFPHKDVTFGNLNISGVYQSASECGGDWWGAYEIEGRRIVLIGDATGHGVPAALVTATANCCAQVLKDLSFNRPEILEDPANILAMMNRVIYNLGGKILMTFFIGVFDENGQSLIYSNASHNPPFLYRFSENEPTKDDLIILMEANGTRLGHTLDTTYENCQIDFNENDVLFLYSDGILEAENQKGKQYGERRFLKSLLKVAKNAPQEMTSQILEDAYDYYEDVPPNDDITLVIVKRG